MKENFSESLIHHLARRTTSTSYHWGLKAADFAARQYSHVRCPDTVQAACVHTETRRTGAEKEGGEIWCQHNLLHWNEAGLHKPLYWWKDSSTLCVMSCTTCIYVPWVCLCRRSWRCNPAETQPAVCGQGRTSHTERLPPAAECACVSPSASCITHTQAHTHTICHLNTILNMTIFTSEFPIE